MRRVCELGSGGYAWMARPSVPGRRWRRMASAAAPPPLRASTATSLAAGLRATGVAGLEAAQQPPSDTISGAGRLAAQQQTAAAGGWGTANGRSSGGDASLAGWGPSASPAAGAPAPQQEQPASEAGQAGTALLLHPSPFDLSLGGAGAVGQLSASGSAAPAAAAAVPAGTSASALARPSLVAAPVLGAGGSHHSSLSAASGKRPMAGSAGGYSGTLGMPSRLQQQAEEDVLLGNSGSQRMFLPWQAAGLQAQAAAAAAVPAQTVSDRASISVLPSLSGPAELWAGDDPPSFVGQQEDEQDAELQRGRRFRLAGGCSTWGWENSYWDAGRRMDA